MIVTLAECQNLRRRFRRNVYMYCDCERFHVMVHAVGPWVASFAPADWRVRVFGPSGLVDRLTLCPYELFVCVGL